MQNDMKQSFFKKCTDVDGALEKYIASANVFDPRTIKRTGSLITKLNYFEVVLNIFEFSRVWENVEFLLAYANKLCWIVQPYFSTDLIKES